MNYFDAATVWNSTTKILTITTARLVIQFEQGVIVYVKDVATDEVIVAYTAPSNPCTGSMGFQYMWASYPPGSGADLAPDSTTATFTRISDTQGRVNYTNDTQARGSTFEYVFTVDESTGEIVIGSTYQMFQAGKWPGIAHISIMNYTGTYGCIMGNGVIHNRSDASVDAGIGAGLGGRWPQVVVAQGSSAVVGMWTDHINYNDSWQGTVGYEVGIHHVQNSYDHLFFMTYCSNDMYVNQTGSLTGGPWRIGTYPNWVEVARSWQARFKVFGGADYLWEYPVSWVQKVHTFHDFNYAAVASPANVAALIDPETVLWYCWNGSGEYYFSGSPANVDYVLIGDHRFANTPATINDAKIAVIKESIPNLLLYQCWNFIYNQASAEQRLTSLISEGQADSDFVFTPDWTGGSLTNWYTTWSTRSQPYTNNDPIHELMLHTATTAFHDYKSTSVAAYAAAHGNNAFFQDVMGVSGADHWIKNGDLLEMDALGYQQGERDTVARLLDDCPTIAYMSEGVAIDLRIPFSYWCHDATTQQNHITNYNHPFYAALMGSFLWQLEASFWTLGSSATMADWMPHILNGIWGAALPCLTITGDTYASSEVTAFSTARARLYCNFGLHHSLPTTWQNWNPGSYPNTLAYYRSFNTSSMFRFEDRGSSTYAWVEEHWQGDYDRLVVDDGGVTIDNIDDELPSILYSRYNYAVLPTDDADLTTIYSTEDIADVATDDTDMVSQSATSQIAIHQFKQQINGTGGIISAVVQVTIPCSTSTTYLQIFNRQSEPPAWDTIDSDNATGANTDFPLSASVSDLTDYKDENNIVACRVYQEMQ